MAMYTYKCEGCGEVRVFNRKMADRDAPLTRTLKEHTHIFIRQIDKPGGISCTYGPMNTR